MDYATGVSYLQQEVAILKSDMTAGGHSAQPGAAVRSARSSASPRPCEPTAPACKWQTLNFGGRNFNGPGFEPTGEPLFQTGATSNAGSYSDPQEDSLISLTHTSDSLTVFQQYATYTAQQLPWSSGVPNYYSVMAVNSKLANVAFNPLATVLPEYWNFTR